MKRELGIGRCGLACCVCSQNEYCKGCNSGNCISSKWCENRTCSLSKGILNCYMCNVECKKGVLSKIKPQGFNLFIKRYGINKLLECLEKNEKNGIVYHKDGIKGDYDSFCDIESLVSFIMTGKK